jgi:lysosomal Pro-X carboxypeptidase
MRILFAFDDYAMGNYPFASTYISGSSPLPPFPARAACALLAVANGGSDDALLAATGAAVNMLYNASGAVECFDLPPKSDEGGDGEIRAWVFMDCVSTARPREAALLNISCGANRIGIWDVQWCTEYMCQETYFTRRPPANGALPAVWPAYAYNATWVDEHCAALLPTFAPPRPRWIAESYYGGGGSLAPMALPEIARASNIFFSNGEYDPWSGMFHWLFVLGRDFPLVL